MQKELVNVLLVEDNSDDAASVRDLLAKIENIDYKVNHVGNLGTCLKYIECNPVDVVLLDLTLPDSNGIDGLQTIQTQTSLLPIILLTNASDSTVALGALRVGAQDYIIKDGLSENTISRAIQYAIHRKGLELQLRRSDATLRQSQKMEALGRLAGGISHDFNNLLTAIMGLGQLVLAELGPDHAAHTDVEKIVEAAKRATSLTRRLLTFSKKQSFILSNLNLNDVVKELKPLLSRTIGEDIEIELQLADDLQAIKVDKTQMEQIIINLAVNARDAMAKGGKLRFSTTNVELDESRLSGEMEVKPGTYILLSVKDAGCGISDKYIENIFEPFFTTKGKERGTGIGLTTVYWIVRQYRGLIEVESTPEIGTKFNIFLPSTGLISTTAVPVTVPTFPTGTETILFVEDDESVGIVGCRMLEMLGYTVIFSRSAPDAIHTVATTGKHFDLILTDVIMPNLDGHDMVTILRKKYNHFKVAYTTGFSEEMVFERGLTEKFSAILPKPFTMETLAHKVREALDS